MTAAFEFDWPEAATTIIVTLLIVILLLAILASPSRTRVGFFVERERIEDPPKWPGEEQTEVTNEPG